MEKTIRDFISHTQMAIIVVAIMGVAASLLGWRIASDKVHALEQARFSQHVDNMVGNLQLRVQSLSLGLAGVSALPLITKGALLPNHFRSYVAARNLEAEFPGALGFGFIRKVVPADLADYIENQREYRPDFAVKPMVGVTKNPEQDYFVIEYIEPLALNRQALGLDVAMELRRREAALRAMRTGKVAISEKIQLVQANRQEAGFLMFLPYYLPSLEGISLSSLNESERIDSLVGWVYTPILASKLMRGLEKYLPADADFEIYSGQSVESKQLLFDFDRHTLTSSAPSAADRLFFRRDKIEVGGQVWIVETSAERLQYDFQHWVPLIILFSGFLFTGFIVALLRSMGLVKNKALILAEEMSATARHRELQMNAMLDSTPDVIILADIHGTIVSANRALQDIFGYEVADVVGNNVSILMPTDVGAQHQNFIKKYHYSGDSKVMGYGRDMWAQKRGGQKFPVEINLNQFEFSGDRFLVAQIRDVSIRYYAEEALQKSERQLELILACSGLGVWNLNLLNGQAFFGGQWGEMLGYVTADLAPSVEVWRSLVHPDDLIAADLALDSHINKKTTTYSCEMRLKTSRGDWKWVLAVGRVYERDQQDRAVRIAGIHLDIDVRKNNELMLLRRETELVLLQNQLSGVINSATEIGIIATDTQGVIRLFSPGAERMLGYEAVELLNIQTPMVFHVLHEIEARAKNLKEQTGKDILGFDVFSYFAKQGVSDTNEWTYVRKNGDHLQVNLSVTSILDDVGEISGYLAIAVNITDQKKLQASMEQAKEIAESASRAKSDFLANMSHEIRTPMNAVIGFSSLLADTGLNSTQEEYVKSIQNSGEALLNLINDLLDFSKIEAGHLELERIEFDLRHTFEGVLDIVSEKATRQSLDLACLVEPSVPNKLIGDPGRLRQVMLNLLNNAIKFTAQGEVVARVSATMESEQCCRLRVTVKDSGIGIAPEVMARLFNPFTQADSSTTRRFGGTGLGLSICRRIVEAMDGEIGVQSEIGQGATFWFEINLGVATLYKDEVESDLVGLRGAKALVVDDFAANRELLTLQLASFGIEAECFADPLQVLASIEQSTSTYALALVDMQLPVMNGIQLAQKLRGIDKNISLILLTSMAVPGLAAEAREAGFTGFLTKPIRQTQLGFVLREALKMSARPEGAKQLLTAHVMAEQIAAQKPYLLLAEDNPINQKVAVLMLEKLGCRVDVADNGRIAFEAVQNHDYDLVLMDCQMPELDGFETTSEIRALGDGFSVLPIVALTANAFQSDIDQCMLAGMNDFVSKPVRAEELQRILIKWVIDPKKKPEVL